MTVKQYIFKYIRDNIFEIHEILESQDAVKAYSFKETFQKRLNKNFPAWANYGVRKKPIKDEIEAFWFKTKLNDDIVIVRKGKEVKINWNPKVIKI